MGRKPIFIILIAMLTMIGCHNLASEVGAGLITGQQFDISYIDTISIHTGTVRADSIVTSGNSRLLVGYHVDEKLGPIMAKSIFQISTPSSVSLPPGTTHYKGLVLHLIRDYKNKYYYYDTTQQMTVNVYRVTKKLNLYNGVLYNVDNFEVDYSSPPLGTLTFYPRPSLRDSLEIPLSDDLGQQLMTMAQNGADDFIPSNFVNFFYGLALIPDSTQSRSFLGFMPTPVMRMYYDDDTTTPGNDPTRYVSFIVGANQFHYSTFKGDLSATKLSAIKTSEDIIPTAVTDHEMYLQGGTGLAMRIEMPYLKNLGFIQSNFQCTRALLTLTPIPTSIDPQNPPPKALTIDLVNSLNQTLSGSYAQSVLTTDEYGNPTYTVDVTSFINGEIITTTDNIHNALLVRLLNADINSTVNRLYLGDSQNHFAMKMKVYYITLTDQ